MKIPVESALHLLHEAACATLATHATQLAGYPYATALPCVVDETHCPMFCISALAEHTRNLLADPRVSLSVLSTENPSVQAAERMTLLGDAERLVPSPERLTRYLRYQPDAKQYLELDFMFFRLRPKRMRYIGGIGKMGWLEAAAWDALPVLSPGREAELLRDAALKAPAGVRLLGIDLFGMDYEAHGIRARQPFPEVRSAENLAEAIAQVLPNLL